MNTMGPMLRVAVYLLFAIVPLAGCGDETAPQGATVVAPADFTLTVSGSGGSTLITDAPLDFRVRDKDGNPLPGVAIRFYGLGNLTQTTALTDRSGVPLNSADPLFFETITDDRGLSPTDVYAQFVVPACSATADLSVTANVMASIGVSSDEWVLSITVKTC